MEKFPLQTHYSQVISRLRELVNTPPYRNSCTIVFDATGLGQPVHEMLRAADLGCPLMPITITSGEEPSGHHVPKKDLISVLQVMLEMHEPRIPRTLRGVPLLLEEMHAMRSYPGESGALRYEAAPGCHDDLVIALALAIWPIRPRRPWLSSHKDSANESSINNATFTYVPNMGRFVQFCMVSFR